MADGLRKRKKNDNVYEASNTDSKVLEKRTSNHEGTLKGSYWLTRIIFIRCLGFIYCKFFLYLYFCKFFRSFFTLFFT